jgi:beta-glucosidase
VLLANNGILPLGGSKTAKLAVIGPNAKTAQIMGGGSAQLNPHYSVSPYQGLATALGEDRLVYAEGCTNHRFEPMPETPFEVEVFASHDFSGPVVHRLTLPQAQGWWSRGFADNKVEHGKYTARATGSFTPPVSGTYNVGIFSAGLARVLVNGQLAADAWSNWRPGRTYFEEGCDPVVAPVDLVGGKSYAVVIEFASRPHITHAFSACRWAMPILRRQLKQRVAPRRRCCSSAARVNGIPRAVICWISGCPAGRTNWSRLSLRPIPTPSWCCRLAGRLKCRG